MVAHYTFEERGGSTVVMQRSMMRGKGWVRLVMSCFGWLMKKQACKSADDELLSLKRLLESGAAESGAAEPGAALKRGSTLCSVRQLPACRRS